MTGLFLQVRLDSQRLPRKALLPLGGLTVTEQCLVALRAVQADCRAVVTEPTSLAELSPLAKAHGWAIFAGDKLNVLDRFVRAARFYQVDTIIRATGDNPLVCAELANRLLEQHRRLGADYSGFQGGPLGSGVEIVQTAALELALASLPDDYEREHVSPYLYRRPETFILNRPPVPTVYYLPAARITLDTPADYEHLQAIFAELGRSGTVNYGELLQWLRKPSSSSPTP